jgi:hypothetical protein
MPWVMLTERTDDCRLMKMARSTADLDMAPFKGDQINETLGQHIDDRRQTGRDPPAGS